MLWVSEVDTALHQSAFISQAVRPPVKGEVGRLSKVHKDTYIGGIHGSKWTALEGD